MPFFSIDALYETLSGVMLTVTNGTVLRINSDATFTPFTGDTLNSDRTYYFAEDRKHVYVAHGGKLARLDLISLTVTLLNENTPNNVTHVCRSKGYLICNGDDVIIASNEYPVSQVFDAGFLNAGATITDMPEWIVIGGSLTVDTGPAIYLSKDNGYSWEKVYSSALAGTITAMLYMGGGVVLAGMGVASGKILRSEDYGATWTDLGALLGATTSILMMVKVTTNIALAGGIGGVAYQSIDNGLTWNPVGTPADFGIEIGAAIVWTPSVVSIGATDAGGTAQLWRSLNGGYLSVIVETLDPASFVTAGVKVTAGIGLFAVQVSSAVPAVGKIYRTTDAGANWTDIGDIGLADGEIPWRFLMTSNGQLIFVSVGVGLNSRLWKSTDDGLNWAVIKEPTGETSVINALLETHTAQLMAIGRVYDPAGPVNGPSNKGSKWQPPIGGGAPQGDVFYSEDISNNYEAVDSWGRFNAEQVPDAVNGVFEHRSLVYAAGPRSIEINYNQADPNQPWAFSDPSLPFGLLAPNSWVAWDQLDVIMYLTDTDNVIQVVRFQSRQQQQMSQEYAEILNDRTLITNPSAAKAWGIAIRGMPHYVISFQADNLTLCYNVLMDHWWRWAYSPDGGTTLQAAIINSYAYWRATNTHLIGDRRDNGKIYTLGGLTDDGQKIRFELTSGNVTRGTDFLKKTSEIMHKVKRGQAIDSSEPKMKVRTRDNGGAWGRYQPISLGWNGQNEFFGAQYHLGQYMSRQYQIVHDDDKSDFIYCHGDETFKTERR